MLECLCRVVKPGDSGGEGGDWEGGAAQHLRNSEGGEEL